MVVKCSLIPIAMIVGVVFSTIIKAILEIKFQQFSEKEFALLAELIKLFFSVSIPFLTYIILKKRRRFFSLIQKVMELQIILFLLLESKNIFYLLFMS
jgi:cytosine/uracil/thiamine/allantoin permease